MSIGIPSYYETIGLVSRLETNDRHIHRHLVEQSKQGDRKAQYELYSLYVDAMFNIGMRMLYSREDAEDVIQDSFIDAFRNLGNFRYESTFGSWLKRIVINKCINHINKKRVKTKPLEDHDYRLHVVEEEEVRSDDRYEIERVKAGITKLSDGYQQIITLYLIEGYDHREISAILNISEGTSKSQYHRAKKKLLEILKSA